MNKPAMASLVDNEICFYVWPLNIDTKSQTILENANINVFNRNIPSIKDSKYNEHTLIIEHITRATDLANTITQKIIDILDQHNISNYNDVVIANEGFSFGSKGDAILDLSGYKYILMSNLIKAGFNLFRTYSPMTLKSTAGCAKRGMNKVDMINRLADEDNHLHKLFEMLTDKPQLLKKKTNYVMCLDDIADSYWCLKKTIKDLDTE